MLLRGLTWLVLFQLLGTALNALFLTLLQRHDAKQCKRQREEMRIALPPTHFTRV